MSNAYRDGTEGLVSRLRSLLEHAEARLGDAPESWWRERIDADELARLEARVRSAKHDDAASLHDAVAACEQWIKRLDAALVIRYAELVTMNALPEKAPAVERLIDRLEGGNAATFVNPIAMVQRLEATMHRAGVEAHTYLARSGDPCAEFTLHQTPLLLLLTPDPVEAWSFGGTAVHTLATTVRATQPSVKARPSGFFSSFASSIGLLNDARIDDDAFDTAFILDTTVEAARETFREPVREALTTFGRQVAAFSFAVSHGIARIEWTSPVDYGVINRAAQLLAAVRHAPVPAHLRPRTR